MNDFTSSPFQENSQEHRNFLKENAHLLREQDYTGKHFNKDEWIQLKSMTL